MTKREISNFVFGSGEADVMDPATMKPTGKKVAWSMEQQVADSLRNNLKVNGHSSGYEIAEVDLATGAVTYRHVDKLPANTADQAVIMSVNCAKPETTLKYKSELKTLFNI